MPKMPKHNDLEHRALQIILNKGKEGILQCDLWRDLKASSREGSRISLKLERKGLIKREQELYDGRWTYRLFTKRQPATIDSIISCPCLACIEINKCGVGGVISPNTCDKLSSWLFGLVESKKAAGGS